MRPLARALTAATLGAAALCTGTLPTPAAAYEDATIRVEENQYLTLGGSHPDVSGGGRAIAISIDDLHRVFAAKSCCCQIQSIIYNN